MGVTAALVVLLLLAAQWWLGLHLASRFRVALRDGTRRGALERVSVCLPCLSYTIHDVQLEGASAEPDRHRLVAPRVVVGLDVTRLLRGELRGRMQLPGATLHVVAAPSDEGGTLPSTVGITWENVGRGLFPFPFARVASSDSNVVLHYGRFTEPIEWRFGVDEASVENLTSVDGNPRVAISGTTPGRGSFEFELLVQERDPPRSTFRGSFRSVPLPALEVYLRERFGLDVEAGEASARIDLAVTNAGWKGRVDCEIVDLALFDFDDVVEGPLQATTDGVAEVFTRMRRDHDGVLRVHLDVEEQVDPDLSETWPWTMTARVVRWVFLAPFELPLRLVRFAEEG